MKTTQQPNSIGARFNNGFVSSIFTAYSSHWNLVLRPDDVWIAITSNFAKYMEKEGEALRSKFVNFEGKKELKVYGNGNIYSANYDQLISDMAVEIEKNTVTAVRSWLEPNFSTTTPNDRTVGRVVLMSAMKKFFDYKMCLMCGIPNVTLEGTLEDWKDIRARTEKLKEYGLEDLGLILIDILDQFIQSYQGNVDKDFWARICHREGGGSGPSYICGWVNAFIAFDLDGNYIINDYAKIKATHEYGKIETDDVPVGAVEVPVTIDDNGKEYKTIFYGGFLMSGFDASKSEIRPQLDWVMIDVTDEK